MVKTRIDVGPGEYVLIAGQTQSGKSIVGTVIARGFDTGSAVVYDPKSDPDAVLPNCAILRSATDVIRHLPGRVVWRPGRMPTARLRADWDRICDRLYDLAVHGYSSTIVIHELADLADAHQIGPAFRQIITQGGQIAGGAARGGGHVGGILITQRPVGIPVIARTEMRHVICLRLAGAEDRDYMAGLMEDERDPRGSHEAVAAFPLPNDHTWWYRSPSNRLTLHDPVALPH